MKVIEVLETLADRLQVAMIVCEHDGNSSLKIVITNNTAATLFEYPSTESMVGLDVKSLMPQKYAEHHDTHISKHMARKDGVIHSSTIMGQWRTLDAITRKGKIVPVAANVADVKNSTERYFVGIFHDMRAELEEKQKLENAMLEMAAAKEQAESLRHEAELARKEAENNLLKQKKLSTQVNLLRQIFGATVGLVVLLAVLVVIGWNYGEHDKESLAMFERILLVLTGMLGSAMAGVFETRAKEKD